MCAQAGSGKKGKVAKPKVAKPIAVRKAIGKGKGGKKNSKPKAKSKPVKKASPKPRPESETVSGFSMDCVACLRSRLCPAWGCFVSEEKMKSSCGVPQAAAAAVGMEQDLPSPLDSAEERRFSL